MADCLKRMEAVSAYADGEMSREERLELELHLESCPFCAGVLEAIRGEKLLVQGRFKSLKAPRSLKKRIAGAIDAAAREEPAPSKPSFLRRLLMPGPAWAAASMVILLAAGFLYLRTEGIIFPGGEKPATVGLFLKDISHDSFLVERLPRRPYDLESGDPEVAERFVSEHVGFDVHLPSLEAEGFAMVGARIWHTVSRISALVDYRDPDGRIVTLFEIPKENLARRGARTVILDGRTFYVGKAFGYNSVCWLHRNVAVGLVGEMGEEELVRIAAAAAASLED